MFKSISFFAIIVIVIAIILSVIANSLFKRMDQAEKRLQWLCRILNYIALLQKYETNW